MNLLNGSDPANELHQDSLSPAEEMLQRQAVSFRYMGLFFAVLLPWLWVYLSFTYAMGQVLAVLALIIMHAGLTLMWFSRRRGNRRLWWARVACYPSAGLLCLLLNQQL